MDPEIYICTFTYLLVTKYTNMSNINIYIYNYNVANHASYIVIVPAVMNISVYFSYMGVCPS